ncbi:2-hydroxyacid dehydrogenase [Microbacterium sp.]|uniref:2-hydroxyacid dehydrogenase n=1 Tax=Microbacterium sp. TaxID=51671 RepID=UPI003C258D65
MSASRPSIVVSVPNKELATALQPAPAGAEILLWDMESPAPRPEIDIVVLPYMSRSIVLPLLAGVRTRLVQSPSIGYEGIADSLAPGHVFANATSVHEASTAELAIALTLASQRRLPTFIRAQDEHRWASEFSESLADRRVLLLGYGGLGKAVAARLNPFEVELTVVASRARFEDGRLVHGAERLLELLPHAQIVIATLPGGDATHHIIDSEALAALPDRALVVNVGRGSVIDTDALVTELERGRLRAALDVTDPEPLPGDHPLWGLPGALIVPHVGGNSSAMVPRTARLIRGQIERMLAGEPPLNVVYES